MSLAAGLAGSAQASIAGALGKRVGTMQAAAFGVVITTIVMVTFAIVVNQGGGMLAALHEPAWLWLGGPLGAVVIVTIAYAPSRIGTLATVALLIAGQLVAGVLIDAFGLLGTARIEMTVTRAAGLVLVTAGAALTLKR
jgi:transporter family-2 protein